MPAPPDRIGPPPEEECMLADGGMAFELDALVGVDVPYLFVKRDILRAPEQNRKLPQKDLTYSKHNFYCLKTAFMISSHVKSFENV